MGERLVAAAEVVERLAQRELEVEAVIVLQAVALKRLLHRRDVVFGEPNRLEVGQAPPRFAERRVEVDRPAVSMRSPSVSRPTVFSMWP